MISLRDYIAERSFQGGCCDIGRWIGYSFAVLQLVGASDFSHVLFMPFFGMQARVNYLMLLIPHEKLSINVIVANLVMNYVIVIPPLCFIFLTR